MNETQKETKHFLLSRTVWVAILSIIIAGVELWQKGADFPTIAIAVLSASLFYIRLTTKTDLKLIK